MRIYPIKITQMHVDIYKCAMLTVIAISLVVICVSMPANVTRNTMRAKKITVDDIPLSIVEDIKSTVDVYVENAVDVEIVK